jgi:glutathione peroxidase-family protein
LPICGFTGLEILAFPCNQFGGQEPGTNEEIVQFACTRFKAEYPIFDKVGFVQLFFSTKLMHLSV